MVLNVILPTIHISMICLAQLSLNNVHKRDIKHHFISFTYDMSINGQMQFSKHIIIVFHEGNNYMVFVDECVGRVSDNLVTGTWLGNHSFCLGRISPVLYLPCSESHKWQEH